MDIPVLVVVLAWLAGGFVSGASGIGGAMIALPVAALFIPIQDVIALSCILNLAMDGMLRGSVPRRPSLPRTNNTKMFYESRNSPI